MNTSGPQRPGVRFRRGWRRSWPALAAAALGLFAFAARAGAQSDPADSSSPSPPSTSALKQLSVDELMDIEVTSVSKSPEKLSETASAIQVITSDDISFSGATNLPEALRLATNLEVAQIDSRQWAISARGFNNLFADKMLVLIDGRTVYTPLYAGVYWDAQETMLEDLDRIEVISGPGATQWGANAVNGVINITTKSAKDTQGALIYGEGGTELTDSGGVRYGGELAPDLYYRVYWMYSDNGDSVSAGGTDNQDAWNMMQGGFRMDWYPSFGNTLTFQGDLYDGGMTQQGPDDTKMNGGNLLGRWTRTLGENSDLRLQVYYDHTYRDIPGSFAESLDTYNADFQYRRPFGAANDVVCGVGYSVIDDNITNTPALAFYPAHDVLDSFNIFGQDKIALVEDHLHLTVGTKLENNLDTGFQLEPSVRLAWTPVTNETVWTAVSRAVRTPSRIDTDEYSPAQAPYRIAGGPNVAAEKLIAYELGYRVQVDPQLSFSVATFYNTYTDLRSLQPLNPPDAFPVEISSGLNGDSLGAELTADWRITPKWHLRAGYTEMRVSSQLEAGSTDRTSSRSVANDPNHQFRIRSMLALTPKWDFDATLRYASEIANQELPGYSELDLRLAWHPVRGWEFAVVGQNLLHDEHAEFNAPNQRSDIPRSAYGKVTWRY